jgi:hypothetical protein
VSSQAKPISEVVKEFEQSLENPRPSTRRVYVAAAKTAIRSAHLELWQCPSTGELLASPGEFPTEKIPIMSRLSGEPKANTRTLFRPDSETISGNDCLVVCPAYSNTQTLLRSF